MVTSLYRSPNGALLLSTGDQWKQATACDLDSLFLADDPLLWLEEALHSATPIDAPASDVTWLPPMGHQEIWAAGVTYLRSREARKQESEDSGGAIFYDKVYAAERPELFFKGTASRCRGHRAPLRIRTDSSWNVPEPEITLAINRHGKIIGYTAGNDMSSRSIEGENPLYLPQAKVYLGSCAMGPCLVLGEPSPTTSVTLHVTRSGALVWNGETGADKMKRGFGELADWLFRENEFPMGAFLMTGTGIVPDTDFTLQSGDEITIDIQGVGKLINHVD